MFYLSKNEENISFIKIEKYLLNAIAICLKNELVWTNPIREHRFHGCTGNYPYLADSFPVKEHRLSDPEGNFFNVVACCWVLILNASYPVDIFRDFVGNNSARLDDFHHLEGMAHGMVVVFHLMGVTSMAWKANSTAR